MATVIHIEDDNNKGSINCNCNGELRNENEISEESKLSKENIQDYHQVSLVKEILKSCNQDSFIVNDDLINDGTTYYLKKNEECEETSGSSSSNFRDQDSSMDCHSDNEINTVQVLDAEDCNIAQDVKDSEIVQQEPFDGSDNENSGTINFNKYSINPNFRGKFKRGKGNYKSKNNFRKNSMPKDFTSGIKEKDCYLVSNACNDDSLVCGLESVAEEDDPQKEYKDNDEVNYTAIKSVRFEDAHTEMPHNKYKNNMQRSKCSFINVSEPTCDVITDNADHNYVPCIEKEIMDENDDHRKPLDDKYSEKLLDNESISIQVEDDNKNIPVQQSYYRGRGRRGGRSHYYNNNNNYNKRDYDYNSHHNRNSFNDAGKYKWQKNQSVNDDDEKNKIIDQTENDKRDKYKMEGPNPIVSKTNCSAYLFTGREINSRNNKEFTNKKNDNNDGNNKNMQNNNKKNNNNQNNNNQNNNNQNNNNQNNNNKGGNDKFEGFGKIIFIFNKVFYSKASPHQPLDSFVLKLHYIVASIIFLLLFALIWYNHYKTQIICVNASFHYAKVDEMLTNICLSYSFLKVENGREYQLFYRWVPFSFILFTIFFYLPRIIMKHMRNPRFTALLNDLHLNSFRNWKDDYGRSLNLILTYMTENLGTHASVLSTLVFLHLLCLCVSGLSFYLIDFELQGRFFWLPEALHFSRDFVKFSDLLSAKFPPFVTCIIEPSMKMQAAREETFNCHFILMEYYEKIFMFIWFFLQVLIATGVIKLIFIVLQFLPFRHYVLKTRISSPNIKKVKKFLLQKLDIGDLFVLYCIKKKINQFDFCLLLDGIRIIIESQQGTNSSIETQENSKSFLQYVMSEIDNGVISSELKSDSSEKQLK